MFKIKKISINVILLTFLLSFYCVVIFNIALFIKFFNALTILSSQNWLFIASFPLGLLASFNLIFSITTIKYLAKPINILIIFISSAAAYFALFYGVIIDEQMITNVVETNLGESVAYFNLTLVLWIFFTGVIPCVFLFKVNIIHYNFVKEFFLKSTVIFTSIIIIALIGFFYSKDYLSIKKNNPNLHGNIIPVYFISSFFKFLRVNYFIPHEPYKTLGLDAVSKNNNAKKNLLIFFVGETARSKNFALNGYNRNTNPFTAEKNVIPFLNMTSCGTATATSVPCIFSRLNRKEFSRTLAKNQDNLLDILNRTNMNVIWIDNDAGCKGVCNNIQHIIIPTNKSKYCNGLSCFDEILLEYLEAQLKSLPNKDTIIVLHLIGSHGPAYFDRYPKNFKTFTPECLRSDIQNCNNDEIINTYDNTIVYTDYVIAKAIDLLNNKTNQFNTAMMYVSDHGESLGEHGLYFHGTSFFMAPDEQTKVPFLMWFSKDFITANQLDLNKLKNVAKTNAYSHDNIFDSILGLMQISTAEYIPDLDIFATLRSYESNTI